jgi:hypothetical protein
MRQGASCYLNNRILPLSTCNQQTPGLGKGKVQSWPSLIKAIGDAQSPGDSDTLYQVVEKTICTGLERVSHQKCVKIIDNRYELFYTIAVCSNLDLM